MISSRIIDKLNQLKELDKGLQVHGAPVHKYRTYRTWNESKISEVESRHNIQLPDVYKQFTREITGIDDVVAGPGYGLLPLQHWSINKSPKNRSNPREDFIYTESWIWNIDDPPEHYYEPYHFNGTITLCHTGCGVFHLLVVKGEREGEIWIDDTCDDYGLIRLNMDMYEWYETWLDDELIKYEIQ